MLLNLCKGDKYEGVCRVEFYLKSKVKNIQLDFKGIAICYISVNKLRVPEGEVSFLGAKVVIPATFMQRKQKNLVEIIFKNCYSFINDGLCSYFLMDEAGRYLLKEQTIYAKNGPTQVARIIPCFNCKNPCQLRLNVLHN